MKIKLTKDEYRNLLHMIYIASWVIHAHDRERGKGVKKEFEKL